MCTGERGGNCPGPAIIYHRGRKQESSERGGWLFDCENLPSKLYPFSKVRRQRVLGKDVKRDPLQAEEQG